MYGVVCGRVLLWSLALGWGRRMAVNWRPSWAAREIIKQNKNLKLTSPPQKKTLYSSVLFFLLGVLTAARWTSQKLLCDLSLVRGSGVLIFSRLLVQDLKPNSSKKAKEAGLASSLLHVRIGSWGHRWIWLGIAHGRLIRLSIDHGMLHRGWVLVAPSVALPATLGPSKRCRSEVDLNWFCHALEDQAIL